MDERVKMMLNVRLLGKRTVKIKLLHIHSNILNYISSDFFYNYDNNFIFYKKHNICKFRCYKFTIPTNPSNINSLCSFVFRNEKERRNVLRRFSKALLDFSKGGHFHSINKKYYYRGIKYLGNNWVLY